MEYSWQEIRDDAIESFRESPGGELEAEVLEQFQKRPKAVVSLIEKIAKDINMGKPIRSGWAVLRSSLRQTSPNVVVRDESEREAKLVAAYSWLSNAGLYIEDGTSVIEELFEYNGLLSAWKGDQNMREAILARWYELRPIGEAAEAASAAYQDRIYRKRGVGSEPSGRSAPAEDSDSSPNVDRDGS